jgi:nucleotide-binding universal stress UspA family protein
VSNGDALRLTHLSVKEMEIMFKHIVFATDGSPSAAKASQTAIELARTNGAKLTVVFVIDPYPYMSLGEGTGDAFQAYMNAAYAASAKVTEDLVEQAKKAGVTMEKSVVEGDDVASAIVMVAEQQGGDLVVVGSHGRTGIQKFILGSVASKVLTMSKVPVLIVR